MQEFTANLAHMMEFPAGGVLSKVLVKSKTCDHTLFCLAKGSEISEHTSTREASILVLRGRGVCIVEGEEINLEPGIFIFMPAHTPHSLRAEEDLAFLLSLSG